MSTQGFVHPSKLLATFGGRARKRFGQNFLASPSVVERIVEAAVDDEGLVEHVLGECVVSLAHELETLRRRLTRRARAREIGWGV